MSDAGVPLLESKLHAPRRRRGVVARRRLDQRLEGGALPAVVLVSAPAGFGKTTLLTEWLAADEKETKRTARAGRHPAINALCFATILYRSGLVPRWMPTIGLIGAPLLLASSTASLFGGWEQVSSTSILFALPIAVWELCVGVYMTVKGFKTPPAAENDATDRAHPRPRLNR